MAKTTFDISALQGRTGYIDPLLDPKILFEHLEHYHVTMYQGNTALQHWGQDAIRSKGKPVLSITRNGYMELLPEDALPDEQLGKYPYKITGRGLRVRLDRLPPRYEHSGAVDGGLGKSEEFLMPYRTLKFRLSQDAENYRLPGPEVARLTDDPSIITGVGYVFPKDPAWKNIVFYAMKRLRIWDKSFNELVYSDSDNCIEEFPPGFDFSLLVPVIKEFGGWVDFSPGIADGGATDITLNLTTVGKDNIRIKAIVQKAEGRPSKKGEKEFVNMVRELFGGN